MPEVRVILHDGSKYDTTVEPFDAVAVNTELKKADPPFIQVGDLNFHKTNVSRIVPKSAIVE